MSITLRRQPGLEEFAKQLHLSHRSVWIQTWLRAGSVRPCSVGEPFPAMNGLPHIPDKPMESFEQFSSLLEQVHTNLENVAEERKRRLQQWIDSNRGLPVLPDQAFHRSSFYGERG